MNPSSSLADAAVPSAAGSLVQTAGALLVVLAAIFALAYLLRRLQGMRVNSGATIKLHGGLQLGPKERVMWVQAGETHLLLGVAPGRVQTLHIFDSPPAPIEAGSGDASTPKFAEILRRALGRTTSP